MHPNLVLEVTFVTRPIYFCYNKRRVQQTSKHSEGLEDKSVQLQRRFCLRAQDPYPFHSLPGQPRFQFYLYTKFSGALARRQHCMGERFRFLSA